MYDGAGEIMSLQSSLVRVRSQAMHLGVERSIATGRKEVVVVMKEVLGGMHDTLRHRVHF